MFIKKAQQFIVTNPIHEKQGKNLCPIKSEIEFFLFCNFENFVWRKNVPIKIFDQMELKKQLKEKIILKEEMEKTMEELAKELEKKGGQTGTLIDKDGYPRSDIDVHQTLISRKKLNCKKKICSNLLGMKTDYKNLLKEIQQDMELIFSISKKEEEEKPKEQEKKIIEKDVETIEKPLKKLKLTEDLKPFLSVNTVSDGSPASESGLKTNDKILKFGDITGEKVTSFGLKILAEFTQQSVNKTILVIIQRNSEILELKFTPKIWSGKGLLGCHLLPIQ